MYIRANLYIIDNRILHLYIVLQLSRIYIPVDFWLESSRLWAGFEMYDAFHLYFYNLNIAGKCFVLLLLQLIITASALAPTSKHRSSEYQPGNRESLSIGSNSGPFPHRVPRLKYTKPTYRRTHPQNSQLPTKLVSRYHCEHSAHLPKS
jgi:hypothetical protein